MTVQTWTGDGLAAATLITASPDNANTAGNGATVVTTVTAASPTVALVTHQTALPLGHGLTETAAVSQQGYFTFTHTAADGSAFQRTYRGGTPPTTLHDTIATVRDAALAGVSYLYHELDDSFLFRSASNSANFAGSQSPVMTSGHDYQVDFFSCLNTATTPTTSNGRCIIRVRDLTDPTTWNSGVEFYFDSGYAMNAGTTQRTNWRAGKVSTGSVVTSRKGGNIRVADIATPNQSLTKASAILNFIPDPSNTAPTSTPPASQSAAVGVATNFVGAGTDPDGTIASYLWNVEAVLPVGATAPTLTNATSQTCTVTGNAQCRVKLGLIVTDNLGATSTKAFTYLKVQGTAITPIEVTGTPDFTAVGAGDLVTCVTDGVDGTLAQYPSGQTAKKQVTYRLAPLLTPSAWSMSLRHILDIADALGVGTVTLLQGATARLVWNIAPTTTAFTDTLTHDGAGGSNGATSGSVASITDSSEMDVKIEWTP